LQLSTEKHWSDSVKRQPSQMTGSSSITRILIGSITTFSRSYVRQWGESRKSEGDPVCLPRFTGYPHICHTPANIHFIETTGQGAFKMRYWTVEPNTSFPTFDLFRTPMIISSILFSSANCTKSSPDSRLDITNCVS